MYSSLMAEPTDTHEDLETRESSDLEKLAWSLKKCYQRDFKIRFLPWDEKDYLFLSEIYVSLAYHDELYYQERLEHYTSIFLPQKGKKEKPRRIFVLGDPGFDKSTFSKKISLDWATEDNSDLKQFKVVVTLFLRTHKPEDTIEDTLCRELLPKDEHFKSDELLDVLKSLQDKCLIVLDGLDELCSESSDIKDIISSKVLADATVIITTRPVESDIIKHANVTAKILGFEPKGIDTYIEKFFKTVEGADLSTSEKHHQCLDEINRKGFHEMSQVPLLLHLLCILFQNFGKLPDTLTDVYKKVKDYVIRRYKLVKSEKEEPIDEIEFHTAIENMKVLAYVGLLTGDLIFDEEELKMKVNKYMLQIGFLSYWDIPRSSEKGRQLTFVHKSFQQYFASEYIVNNNESTGNLFKSKDKVLGQKMLISMCCGHSPSAGVEILKKIQNAEFMSKEKLCTFQMECLCEAKESVDISALHCYGHLAFSPDFFYVPVHVKFKPKTITLEELSICSFEANSLKIALRKKIKERAERDEDVTKKKKVPTATLR